MRVRRVTLDTSCINAKQRNEYLNQLEEWDRRGWVKLQKAEAMNAELKGEQPSSRGVRARCQRPGRWCGSCGARI